MAIFLDGEYRRYFPHSPEVRMNELSIGGGNQVICSECGVDYGYHSRNCSKAPPPPTLMQPPQPGDDSSEGLPRNFVTQHDIPIKARLTVLYRIYYERPNRDPKMIASNYSRNLESTSQHFEREIEVGEYWEPIKGSWIEKASIIVIENVDKNTALQLGFMHEVNAEKDEADLKPSLIILPGECQPLTPYTFDTVRIRSCGGIIQVNLYVIPS